MISYGHVPSADLKEVEVKIIFINRIPYLFCCAKEMCVTSHFPIFFNFARIYFLEGAVRFSKTLLYSIKLDRKKYRIDLLCLNS